MVAPKQPKPGQDYRGKGEGGEHIAVPGKVTRVEQQYGTGNWEVETNTRQLLLCTPNLAVCLNAPSRGKGTYLDPLFSLTPEEVERVVQDKLAGGRRQVCGTLPLGGVFFGSGEAYQRAVGIDNFEIQIRILKNIETSAMASISGAVMKMQAEDDARILDATDAMVLLSTMLGAVTRPASERADRSTTNTELSKPTTEQRPPTKTTQSEKPEPQHFHEAEPVHLHPKPHTPVVKIPRPLVQRIVYPKPKPGKAPGEKRKVKLKDDLKRRSVRTWLNGKRNDDFDIETPEHMHEHFKAEQLRTGSNSPRKWRNPPGYEAQHPNGRSFDHYGDLPGTVLHWGTKEDNGKMQNTREREGVPKIRQR